MPLSSSLLLRALLAIAPAMSPLAAAAAPAAAPATAATSPMAAPATDCPARLARHLSSDLSLPFDAFDQDDQQGWRALEADGCDSQAADLVAAYAAQHPHPVLAWHRAQLLARAGRTPEAIQAARSTLQPPRGDDASGFDWNDYANATIAFLEGDPIALKANRDRLAVAAGKMAMNGPNLRSADRLVACFGQPYKVAYDCPAVP